ncbi:MAG TPA: 23S rRNA (guanosine(2251)-2'-O)-methyltransferase RlmB [Candidatus Limnocylindrales bacterium]|nr:23S rRNA (guanosine(2251)-2'-O)-methyltransferase RlmB [Candidatus Limnocylindrales bacterium]
MDRPPERGFRPRAAFDREPRPDRPWSAAPPPDLLAEDEEIVAGRRPVEEAFVARRAAKRLLVVPSRRQALERLVLHATSLRIPVVEVEGGTLTAVAGFDGHQGIALVVEPRTFASVDEVLARAVERGEPPFVLVMDSLEDPQNVGTLLRSAEAAGVHGVVFPTHRQAPLSPAAVKASAGAVEHLLLAPVDDLPGVLSDLRIRGLRIAAAEADAPMTADQADLRGPLAIIVGSEGQGLSPAVRRRADLAIRIPMRGAIASLNAAVAGSILLFAAVAQRGGEPPPPPAPGGPSDTPIEATTRPEPASTEAPPPEPEPAPAKSRRTRAAPAPVDAPAVADAELEPPPAKPRRPRKKASEAAEPASAAPVTPREAASDDLLPGTVTASKPRSRKSRTTVRSDPDRA